MTVGLSFTHKGKSINHIEKKLFIQILAHVTQNCFDCFANRRVASEKMKSRDLIPVWKLFFLSHFIYRIPFNTCTITLNSSVVVFSTLFFTGAISLAGSFGCIIVNCSIAAGSAITWKNSDTYTVTTSLVIAGTLASYVTFVSSTPGSTYNFVVPQGASIDVAFVNTTDAKSDAGLTIGDYKGIDSGNNTNWLFPQTAQPISTAQVSVT